MSEVTSGATVAMTEQAYDALYQNLVLAVKENVSKVDINTAIFLVDVKETKGKSLFTHYLSLFDEAHRQQYFCHTCAEWLKQFGQMVTVENGVLTAFAFAQNDNFSATVNDALAALAKVVESCPIVAQKPDNAAVLKITDDGSFTHFSGKLNTDNRGLVFTLKGAERIAKINEWKEAARVVTETLGSYTAAQVQEFSDLFVHGQFSFAKKFAAEVAIFSSLHREYHASKHNHVKTNLVWEALGENFVTLYHFKGSSVGALLGYIADGESDHGISEFKKYTDSINYKRPTELPTDREIELAKARVTEEGLESAFQRRFATPDDIQYLFWKPAPTVAGETKPTSIFDGMEKKVKVEEPKRPLVRGGSISFMKFANEILPGVNKMFVNLSTFSVNNLVQLVAATDLDAKPLIKHDSADARNTVTQYVYHGGSLPSNWFTGSTQGVEVTGITVNPDKWANPVLKYGIPEESVILLLKGAKDKNNHSLALFPEFVADKYRDLRRVIEQYSNTHKLDDVTGEVAAGLSLVNGSVGTQVSSGKFELVVEMQDGARVVYEISNYM